MIAAWGARIIQSTLYESKFNESEFLEDLKQKAWKDSSHYSNPNDMWKAWRDCLMECITTHALLRHVRVDSKTSPWITDNLRHKMPRKRDLLKSKAASTNDPLSWERFKRARNHTNNDVRKAKRKYFNKGITCLFEGILFICARVVTFAARARSANDTTRAQTNNIPQNSHVIIIIINKQGQMISIMRVFIMQAKEITNSKSFQIIV